LTNLNAFSSASRQFLNVSHSLIGADRSTHLKIVGVALVSAIILIMVGVIARMADSETTTARLQADGPVLKVGKPATFTNRDGSTVR
jgi:hypothetical protein